MAMDEQSPPSKKIRTLDDLSTMSKEELVNKCQRQREHIELLQAKSNSGKKWLMTLFYCALVT